MYQVNNTDCINLLYNQTDFENEIKNILREYMIDSYAFLSISQNTAIWIISFSLNDILDYRFSEFFDFIKHKKNGIYKSVVEKRTYINNADSEIETFIKQHEYEMFLPIKINNLLAYYIVLSSKYKKIPEIDLKKLTIIIKNYFHIINSLEIVKIENKKFSNSIILLEK